MPPLRGTSRYLLNRPFFKGDIIMIKMKKLVRLFYSEEVKPARASLASDFKKAFQGVMALIVFSCVPGSWAISVSAAFGLNLPTFLVAVSPGITATLIVAAIGLRLVQFALEVNPKPTTTSPLARP